MMLRKPSSSIRRAKMGRDFLKLQMAEIELPGGFARSSKKHEATPAEKEDARKKITAMKELLKTLEKVRK